MGLVSSLGEESGDGAHFRVHRVMVSSLQQCTDCFGSMMRFAGDPCLWEFSAGVVWRIASKSSGVWSRVVPPQMVCSRRQRGADRNSASLPIHKS
uniref:Uncharacterized protein n=1 Tax=Physcomitrium patens TaxID=3218 RepID=A0A2K1IA31_PHYPA|nr:hypothetical protein PHYPA_030705 [Physcomitrium patens]